MYPESKGLCTEGFMAGPANRRTAVLQQMQGEGPRAFRRLKIRLAFLLVSLLLAGNAFSQNGGASQLRRAYLSEKNATKKYWKLYSLARHYQKNDVEAADSIRRDLLVMSRQENDSARLSAIMFDLEIDEMQGNLSGQYMKTLQLQPFLGRMNDPEMRIAIFHKLAGYNIAFREYDQAELYLDEAEALAKRSRNYAAAGENYRLKAWLRMEQNQKQEALKFVDQSIQYSRRSADKSLLARCFNMQSKIYLYFGQVELSVSKNLIALELATEAQDFPDMADYHRELGEAQYSINNYLEASRNFVLSKEIAQNIRDRHSFGLVLIDLGLLSSAKKEYPQATARYREAIGILQNYNDEDGLGFAHMYLGSAYRETNKYDEALRFYNKALVYFESSANRTEIASVYHLVGTTFEKQGKYANALTYLNRAVEIRSQFGFTGAVYPSYRAIAEVYQKTGNLKLAYDYLERYSDYSDSAKTVEVSAKIAEISELYRSEQLQRTIAQQAASIELQRKEQENTKLRNIFQTYIIIGFVVILILGGLIFYTRWKQRNTRQLQREAEMAQVLLRSQMNPHFVFNAMSVIQSYIYENDTKNSSKFLVNFSKLMRLILENSSKEFIPIATEEDILTKYLETQKLRFGDRFEYEVNIPQALKDEELVIPPMITQPFIENAIEHGQLHTIDGGFIRISFAKENEMLQVVIEDNGIGRKGSELNKKSHEHKSMAMKITQDRIDNLSYKYRVQGSLAISDFDEDEQTGTRVVIFLPYRTENLNISA
jgi:tetratricopeptide (TPR) repeat protein